eukprot:464177_1
MEYCLPDFKGIKRTCLYLGLLFSIMFGLFFWTTQINGYHEIETNKLEPFQYMQKYKSLLLNTNKSNILNKLNKLNNSPQTMPPISLNKNNNPPKQDWWNIDTSFTNCEQKLLGWKQNRDKLTTFNSNDKNIICENNNLLNDLRHAHIECYDKQWRGTHICILKNIYGYITNSKDLKFKAFCKQNVNKQKQNYIEKIKQQFKSKNPENTNFPLYLDIISDTNNDIQELKINNIFYKNDNNDIYYYDNSHQCEWHKKNDNEHIGNPWHCFGHIEYWFGIAYMRNITMDKYNITVIQSQFNDNKFGPKEAIYHFYDAFFQNVINKNVLPLSTISELLYTTSNDQVQNQNSELLWIIIICVLIAIILLFGGCFLIFKIQKIAKNKRAKMQIELEQFQTDDNRINQNHNSSDIDGNNEIFNNTLQKNITQTNIGRHNQDLNETDDELYETNDTETIGNTNTGTDTAGMEQTAGQV